MILLTGFEPFDGMPRNPSGEVARALAGPDVAGAVLPVDFEAVEPTLRELLADPYEAVLLTGVAVARSRLSLERVALNFRDGNRRDNRGAVPASPEVVRGAPAAYFSTLPLDRLLDRLDAAGFPVEISLTAGAYLCNASFFLARHMLEARGTPCGFLHLPPTPGLERGGTALPLEEQVRAVALVLDLLAG